MRRTRSLLHASASIRLVLPLLALACAPRAAPLVGAPAPAVLPSARLEGAQQIVFRWEFEDGTLVGRGEGVARIAAPDSLRLDFFLDGGLGGGTAFLIGDRVEAPGGDLVRRLLPPPPLLWASLGRLAVPPAADTAARADGSLLRADIGREPVFRVTFDGARLVRMERLSDGRLQEWVARANETRIEYRHEASRRRLALDITRTQRVEGFDASTWIR